MIKGLINWISKKTEFLFPKPPAKEPVAKPTLNKNTNQTYLIDASSPTLIVENPVPLTDRKSTRLNSSHSQQSRMPSSA